VMQDIDEHHDIEGVIRKGKHRAVELRDGDMSVGSDQNIDPSNRYVAPLGFDHDINHTITAAYIEDACLLRKILQDTIGQNSNSAAVYQLPMKLRHGRN